MKKIFTGPILLLLLISGCENTEIVQLNLKGAIKGTISAYDEFGNPSSTNENIVLQLEGSEPLISAFTDMDGKYEINDIPSGTYNLIISKAGYDDFQRQGIPIVGGNETLYFNGSIVKKSSTVIEDLSLEMAYISEIRLKGVVYHNYVMDGWSYNSPTIRYFIHQLDNPSETNFLQSGTLRINQVSGSPFDFQVYLGTNSFPSGTQIYIIAYGCNPYSLGYYDILSNQYKFSGLGTASNVASITMP